MSLHQIISEWKLPPGTHEKFEAWLSHTDQGFNLEEPPYFSFYEITEDRLTKAGFNLNQSLSILKQLKPAAGTISVRFYLVHLACSHFLAASASVCKADLLARKY